MSHHSLAIFDLICVTFLAIHLTDLDLAFKLTASGIVIVTNAVVLYKKLKK